MYGGGGVGRLWRGWGGRWLGGSLLALRQGFVLLAVGRDVCCAGSRHIPKVLAAEDGERSQGIKSNEKAFSPSGLLGQIF